MRLIDLTGVRVGSVVVLRRDPASSRNWICACDCGRECSLCGVRLRAGEPVSCGCKTSALMVAAKTKHGHSRTNGEWSITYKSWAAMRRRCGDSPSNDKARWYRDRGITVCERWDSYAAFLEDMGERPSPKHSIDRIDVNGNYEPGNCRWATWDIQMQNRRPRQRKAS
jgi:hypothetical protein